MSLVERVKAAVSALTGKPAGRTTPDWPQQYMHWAFQLADTQLDHVQAFYNVPIVNSGVRMLAEHQASVPRKVWRGRGDARVEVERIGKPVELGGNLADLLSRANSLDTGRALIARTCMSLSLSGNGYWFLQSQNPAQPLSPKNLPVEVWNLPGHLTRPQPAPGRRIELYDYDKGGTGNFESIASDLVVHFRKPSPKDEPIGMSDLEAVRDSYMAHYFAHKWLREFFQKGGVLSGLWSIDGETSRKYSNEELDAMAEGIRSRTIKPDGTARRWEPIIVAGFKFLQQGMTMSEMQLADQLTVIDNEVLRALGIPPLMLGVKAGESALSTSASTEAMNYWLGTQKAIASLIDDTINERLAPFFGTDVWVEADFAEVPAVQALMVEQAKAQKELAGGVAIITANEAREHGSIGLEPRPEGDELYRAPAPMLGVGPSPSPKPEGATPKDDKQASRNARLTAAGPDRDELRRKAVSAVERFQRDFERLVTSRLAEQRGDVKARLRAAGEDRLARRARLQTIDPRDLIGEPDDADLERAQELLERLLVARGIDAVRDLEAALDAALDVAVAMNNERAAEFVRKMVERAISIPDATTRQALRGSLADGIAAGESLSDLVARADAVFDARMGQALTIVRTESVGAYNFASVEAWQQTGVVDRHEWLTSRSGLGGRHSEDPEGRYVGLDGQVRALGEPFDVGGFGLLYPGDPGGPAGETINCVCTTLPIVNEDRLSMRRVTVSLKHSRNGNGKAASHRLAEYFAGVEK